MADCLTNRYRRGGSSGCPPESRVRLGRKSILEKTERWLSGCPPEAGPPWAEKQLQLYIVVRVSMSCIYVLLSQKTKRIYIGSSREDSGEIRLLSHNRGKTISTKSGIPWEIVYQEIFKNYTDARKREIFLKTGSGRRFVHEKIGK